MESTPTALYLDWQFWSAVVAILALILSQLPPVFLWFRPKRLEVEVHSLIQVTHKVGNPNVGMFVSIRNTGGRELRIRSLRIFLSRDNASPVSFPAQNYFESPSSESSVLFVPFTLRPGETWEYGTNFLNFFDRSTEKAYREAESKLGANLREKLAAREQGNQELVTAEPALVEPFTRLFQQLFIWEPGEYVIKLVVDAEPGSASFSRQYRFTLFESDSAELHASIDSYKFGDGITYNSPKHVGVFIPLSPHGD